MQSLLLNLHIVFLLLQFALLCKSMHLHKKVSDKIKANNDLWNEIINNNKN
jgi:hypothetical protein